MPEYRIEELAAASGTRVRTVQSYRNKGLLPPPRRQGRVAVYSDDHVERLRLIADLIGRGYSLNAVSELLDGLDRGDRIHDLLGLGDSLDRRAGPERRMTADEIVHQLGDLPVLDLLRELGVIEPVGDDTYRVELPAALEAGAALLAAGTPPLEVLEVAHRVARHADEIAQDFVELVAAHLIADGAVSDPARHESVTELAEGLVPHATAVLNDYLDVAMRRQIRNEIERQLSKLLDPDATGG